MQTENYASSYSINFDLKWFWEWNKVVTGNQNKNNSMYHRCVLRVIFTAQIQGQTQLPPHRKMLEHTKKISDYKNPSASFYQKMDLKV